MKACYCYLIITKTLEEILQNSPVAFQPAKHAKFFDSVAIKLL